MKKFAGIFLCMMLLCATAALAQDDNHNIPGQNNTPTEESSSAPETPQKPAEYNVRATPKMQFSVGYSYRAYSPTASTTLKLNGGYISGEYNIFSWVGVLGEGTAAVRKQGASSLGTAQTLSVYSGLVGPEFYPLKHRKVTLFGHVLVGDGYYYLYAPAAGGFSSRVTTSSGLSFEAGAGVDVRIKRHWSLRLAEGDYGETSFSVAGANPHQVTYRISAGIVYLRGEK